MLAKTLHFLHRDIFKRDEAPLLILITEVVSCFHNLSGLEIAVKFMTLVPENAFQNLKEHHTDKNGVKR